MITLARLRVIGICLALAVLAGCAGSGSSGRGGGYYKDDGPGSDIPANIRSIPDAVPRIETHARANMRPYVVFGKRYVPISTERPYRETGVASWYGRKFHGNSTANGETYDMYAMTAAHRTLPLPSYVRVTNLSNGRSVIVRVNDRGPFMKNRLIDLSWTAAKKLGFIEQGHARVRVELVLPGEEPAPREDVASASVAPSATTTADASLPAPGALATNTGAPGTALAAAQATTAPAGAGPAEGGSSGDSPRGFAPVASDAADSSGRRAEDSRDGDSSTGSFVRVDASPRDDGFAVRRAIDEAPPAGPAHYLQLGAYESRAGAIAALADLGRRLDWLGGTLSIHPENGQYKIHAGPWADAAQARQVAERIRAETRIEAFGVRREPGR